VRVLKGAELPYIRDIRGRASTRSSCSPTFFATASTSSTTCTTQWGDVPGGTPGGMGISAHLRAPGPTLEFTQDDE